MKTIVLGGGVVGVTTAYYLSKEGHEVSVIEAAKELGSEATAGNAGLIAPGHSFAWASPRAPGMLVRSLAGQETAIRVRLKPDPHLYQWGLRFLRECTAERARRNTLVKLQLCQYSQRCLNEVVQEEGIEYEAVNKGVIYLYRDGRHLEAGAANMQLLAEHGQKIEVLDAGQVVGLEPVFQPVEHKIAGAIYGLTDASGDAQLFSKNLSKVCEALGATFHLGTRARGLIAEGDLVTGVVTQDGILTADNYVLSLGVESPAIAKTIGVRIPIYPAKGYSVTFPLGDEHTPPSIGGVDEELLVAWSRLGSNLRMTSTAEFCGHDRTWNAKDFSNIFKLARDLLPNGADYSAGRYRACLRPMTPDGPPVIGLGRHRNLYYNTGHGHMGWTMACGSSRAVVDVMLARDAGIDLTGHKFRW